MRSSQSDDAGFVMVVLIIVMGVGAVWMTASLPAWKQQATREKEAELLFRGKQYVHALQLFERKNGPATKPASVDLLVDGKFLRKKYKDPITNDDFLPVMQGGTPTGPTSQTPGQVPGRGGQPASPAPNMGQPQQPSGLGGASLGGLIFGVQSKSSATSIMTYNGATHYNEWQFTFAGTPAGQQGRPGGPGGGPATPGGQRPGGPGGVPTGPGRGFNPQPLPPGTGRGPITGPPTTTGGRGRGGF